MKTHVRRKQKPIMVVTGRQTERTARKMRKKEKAIVVEGYQPCAESWGIVCQEMLGGTGNQQWILLEGHASQSIPED